MNASFLTSAVALIALTVVSCGSPEPEQTAPPAGMGAMTYAVDPANSSVEWSGNMGMIGHSGTLKFNDGSITTDGGKLTGGEFTVDMKNYALTDTNYAADGAPQGTRSMLMGHLMSPDFFAVDSFPTAQYKITSVDGNTAMGDLTVRGKTNSEQVTDIVVSCDSMGVKASGNLTFNRQKYGVAWKSPMKDMVLSNSIDLKISLTGTSK